jgi:hypothetical protein
MNFVCLLIEVKLKEHSKESKRENSEKEKERGYVSTTCILYSFFKYIQLYNNITYYYSYCQKNILLLIIS